MAVRGWRRLLLSVAPAWPPEAFDRWRPEFERWLSTLTFARVAEKPTTIAERLWTPLLVGAVVGLVLVLLYRYTRTRR